MDFPSKSTGKNTGRVHSAKAWVMGDRSVSYRKRRYCGQRIGFCGFVCCNICCLLALLAIILIPIMYCVVVPNMIQQKFDGIIRSGLQDVQSISFSIPPQPNPNNYNLHFDIQIPAKSSIPGTAEIVGPTSVYLADPSSPQRPWGTLTMSGLSIILNQPSTVSADARFDIWSLPPIASLLPGLINRSFLILVNVNVAIKVWGTQWYGSLPLHSVLDINSRLGRQFLTVLQRVGGGKVTNPV